MDNHLPTPNTTIYTYKQLFQLAIDYYQGSIIIIDADANILYCNEGSSRMLNVSRDWLMHHTMHDVMEAGLAHSSAGLEALEKKMPIQRYIPNQHGEGMLLSSIPILNDKDEVEVVLTYSQDEEFLGNYMNWMNAEKNRIASGIEYIAKKEYFYSSIVAESQTMKAVLEFSAQIASSNSTVALYGESGVGKEVLASYIHNNSKRADNIFLPVNCAAIPPELVESEFFGYEKGAFTGALKEGKPGLFEIANHGTIFLDEIGDLPLSIQVKLLRVLENREVRRVGGNKNHKIDIRIICATNRDLRELVANHTFREDLYYRINVIPVRIPPLRDRKDDILPLANSFLNEFNRKNGCHVALSKKTIETLKSYSWPGNVRELRNVMERMVITTPTNIMIQDLQSVGTGSPNLTPANDTSSPLAASLPLKASLKKYEASYIAVAYEQCNYNVEDTAKLLQIHRSGLYKKLQDYGLLHKRNN